MWQIETLYFHDWLDFLVGSARVCHYDPKSLTKVQLWATNGAQRRTLHQPPARSHKTWCAHYTSQNFFHQSQQNNSHFSVMIPVTCAGAIVFLYCKGCFTACFYQLLTCYFLRGIFMNCLPEVFADSPFPHCLLVQLIRHFLTSCKASFNQSLHSAKHQWAMQRKSALFRLFSPKINIMEQRIILLWLHIGKKYQYFVKTGVIK